jgi:valyl-tRNA synthetase
MSEIELAPKITEKVWNPSLEIQVLNEWENSGIYKFNKNSRKKIFIIDTPPPYPSGRPWHIGAAAQYAQIDMIARTARMMGYEVRFPIGIDRNGIPVEKYVERELGVRLTEVSRPEFLKLCSDTLDKLEAEMISIMRRMGLSGELADHYRTDSEDYRALTQATFIELFKRGLIYISSRPNNYCWECGTTVADAEIDYRETSTRLVYMKFTVKETGEVVIVASTRPELLCACRALIYNPSDNRYAHLEGMTAIVPIYGQEVPIIPHKAARPEFGSGLVMVCSYGDQTDVQLFRELGLSEVIAIDTSGKMTEVAGPLSGLPVKEAREKIIEMLQSSGLVEKIENIIHNEPICERSGTPIEIIPMNEFYLKQLEYKEELLRIIDKMKFHPPFHRQLLIDWINSLMIDWPISRRRYYATEIPIWYCKNCGEPHLPKPGKYYRPWIEKAPFEKCSKCGSTEFIGEERTFDTWMDSSITPLFISGYKRDSKLFRRAYPTGIRPQGKDIVRTWLYYTVLRCYQLTGRPPFKNVWIGGLGLDEKGEKMSKSRGNVIDPVPILEKYGADVFRYWSAQEASLGYDFRISEQRIASAGKFLTKLWNVARFVSQFPYPRKARLLPTDRWILAELNKLVNECLEGYNSFNFFIPATKIRDFLWNTFADHYIEMVKGRALSRDDDRESARAAWYMLHTCLKTCILLLAPITPFITEYIWKTLYSKKSIHLQRLPNRQRVGKMTVYTEKIKEFNSSVWRAKKMQNKSLRDPIHVDIPDELKSFKEDLIRMHNIV